MSLKSSKSSKSWLEAFMVLRYLIWASIIHVWWFEQNVMYFISRNLTSLWSKGLCTGSRFTLVSDEGNEPRSQWLTRRPSDLCMIEHCWAPEPGWVGVRCKFFQSLWHQWMRRKSHWREVSHSTVPCADWRLSSLHLNSPHMSRCKFTLRRS